MKLYIAEKPSLGRAIANALPGPQRKGEGCLYLANGDCVTWCVGHLLEPVEPDAYDPRYKSWRLEDLPIVPQQWQLKPRASSRKQLSVLRKLVKQATVLVHAGDPDREGQLLVDEVVHYLNVPEAKRRAMQRLLISDLNPEAVSRALGRMQSNQDFVALSQSALARSRADWLYGMNMTRAYTLQGRQSGYNGVLSVGRVQTPVLGLVVQRDQAIADFQSKPFYEVLATLKTDSGEHFNARWLPSEACQNWQDEEGRVLDRRLAEHVVAQVREQPAEVLAASNKEAQQPPPLLYNLSSLQIDAAKRFGLSAKAVLDACQSLYEKHQLLTYPRSDCRYLPSEHYADRERVLASIEANSDEFTEPVAAADTTLKSRVWNDAKVGAHHAIVPTQRRTALNKLSRSEQQVYQLVARQYIAQFYPPQRYRQQRLLLQIKSGQFEAKARQLLSPGWTQLFPAASGAGQALNSALPMLQQGEFCHCINAELLEKQTSAPKPFDDASLLAAMTGIARYVSDASLRAVLKETDGLGTEATRAGIIELLFKRNFLQRQGKRIHATATGKALIAALPEQTTSPDMTARWELQLEAICQQEASYSSFMSPLTAQLYQLIAGSRQANTRALAALPAAPKRKAFKKRASGEAVNSKHRQPSAAKRRRSNARKTTGNTTKTTKNP